MNDDVKKALEELTQTFAIVHRVATHQTDDAYMSIPANPKRDADLRHAAAVEALRAHINGEPARLAAAVAREREEQREALGLGRWPALIPFLAAMVRKLDANRAKKGGREGWQNQEPGSLVRRVIEEAEELEHAVDTKGAREILLEAADVANMAMMVADASGALDATPLTATPLADENKALREDLEHERKTNARLLAERDAALKAAEQAWHVETMSRERREAIQRAESAEAIRDAALTQRDTALARAKELEADVEVGKETCRRHGTTRATAADGWPASKLIGFLSHSLAGKDAAIKDAAESASQLRSERDTLKAQRAEAVEVLKSFADAVQMFDVDFVDAEAEEAAGKALFKARDFLAKVKL